jgi:hypothetical protein
MSELNLQKNIMKKEETKSIKTSNSLFSKKKESHNTSVERIKKEIR